MKECSFSCENVIQKNRIFSVFKKLLDGFRRFEFEGGATNVTTTVKKCFFVGTILGHMGGGGCLGHKKSFCICNKLIFGKENQ